MFASDAILAKVKNICSVNSSGRYFFVNKITNCQSHLSWWVFGKKAIGCSKGTTCISGTQLTTSLSEFTVLQ
jgi:hypothetical protein